MTIAIDKDTRARIETLLEDMPDPNVPGVIVLRDSDGRDLVRCDVTLATNPLRIIEHDHQTLVENTGLYKKAFLWSEATGWMPIRISISTDDLKYGDVVCWLDLRIDRGT